MNTLIKINTVENKTVYICAEHVKAIYVLQAEVYSVIYGDSEDSYVQVDKENLMLVLRCFTGVKKS